MKKIYSLLSIAFLTASFNISFSQCGVHIYPPNPVSCAGDSVDLLAIATGPNSLTTTFAAGNNQRGNMFDIVATNTVVINSFEGHLQGDTDMEIYYKVGTHAGFETNASAWTLVGSAQNVVAASTGSPTLIPINVDITIPAGDTYAFYVTSSNPAVSINYTNGTTFGAVYASDANISFLEGTGVDYPFGSGLGTFAPRIWNGIIHYYLPGAKGHLWSNLATTNEITVAPPVATQYNVQMSMSGCAGPVGDTVLVSLADSGVFLGPDTSICQGQSITFDATIAGATYQWSDMTTNPTLTTNTTGSYYVDITVPAGCTISDTINLLVTTPYVYMGPDTSICKYETILLDAGPGSDYAWFNGDTGRYFTFNSTNWATGLHFLNVSALDSNGCADQDFMILTVLPAPDTDFGPDTTICINHSLLLDAGSADTYNWSTGATSQTITLSGATLGLGTHTYFVTAVGPNGCAANDTITVTVDACSGIDKVPASAFSVYPNPVNEVVTISSNNYNIDHVEILDVSGRRVFYGSFYGNPTAVLNLGSFNSGLYMIKVYSGDSVITKDLVVR